MHITTILITGITSIWTTPSPLTSQAADITSSLAMDGLGLFVLVSAIVVSLIGLWAYIGQRTIVTFGVQVLLLVFGVFLLVSATNLILFYVMWEGVTFLVWGISRRTSFESFPALGPLPVQGVGGIATISMLGAILLLSAENRSLQIGPSHSSILPLITILLLTAVFFKSYGLLTQTWLHGEPRASGISNSIIVGGGLAAIGIYPYVRIFWTMLGSQNGWRDIALPVSLTIGIVAAIIALGEHDSRRLLSYGALSQFSWFLAVFALFGVEQSGPLFIATLTITMAMSGLFIAMGLAESISGERDLRQTGGLIRLAPLACALFILLVMATVGLPPFAAFVSRMCVEIPLLVQHNSGPALALFAITILTLLYLTRLFGTVFLGKLPHPAGETAVSVEYLAIGALIVILLAIGLASPLVMPLMQASFSMPIG